LPKLIFTVSLSVEQVSRSALFCQRTAKPTRKRKHKENCRFAAKKRGGLAASPPKKNF
jgi:hypothetical protein